MFIFFLCNLKCRNDSGCLVLSHSFYETFSPGCKYIYKASKDKPREFLDSQIHLWRGVVLKRVVLKVIPLWNHLGSQSGSLTFRIATEIFTSITSGAGISRASGRITRTLRCDEKMTGAAGKNSKSGSKEGTTGGHICNYKHARLHSERRNSAFCESTLRRRNPGLHT